MPTLFKTITTGLILSGLMAASGAHAAGPKAAAANGDPVKGGALFNAKCGGCHTDVAGKNSIGPSLFGVYGRTAGTAAGYTYSNALKASGIVWTADTLTAWLTKPPALVPGTKMAFAPPTKPDEKTDLIAYLKSKK